MKVSAALCLLLAAAGSVRGFEKELVEDFGYVEVRPGAHVFWVTYHVDQPGDWTEYPLIMWLQGGPGASGVGYGNFEELGPYYTNGSRRETAWTKKANVMFVDNPVGTGFSYVESPALLATTNQEIADDLVTMLTSVFAKYPDMSAMPFFVYAESYGGKMTVDFALALDKAIKSGKIKCNFRGVSLGDSWISPMDSINTWGPYLYNMGFVNRQGLEAINEAAQKAQAAVDAGEWEKATDLFGEAEYAVFHQAGSISFYNVLSSRQYSENLQTGQKVQPDEGPYYSIERVRNVYESDRSGARRPEEVRAEKDLMSFMNGPMAKRWNIPKGVYWSETNQFVFSALSGDFMKPVVQSVVALLETTNIAVAVATADLDLICDTPGTYRWVENMQWSGKAAFDAAPRHRLHAGAEQGAYVQVHGNLALYTILNSGHMVPLDAPETALQMVDSITKWAGADRHPATTAKNAEVKRINDLWNERTLGEGLPAEVIVQRKRNHYVNKNFQQVDSVEPNIQNDLGVSIVDFETFSDAETKVPKPSILMSKIVSVVYEEAIEGAENSSSEVAAINRGQRYLHDVIMRRLLGRRG